MPDIDECALYSDAELYDSLFPDARDVGSLPDEARRQRILTAVEFYVQEADPGRGPILDLACGSGRLTLPLAQRGATVTAIDLSASMLAAGRTKAVAAGFRVQFIQADMRTFDLKQRFATILLAGNALLHLLPAEDLLACLANVRGHLAEGGQFIFDVAHWDVATLARDPSARIPVMSVQHARLGTISIEERSSYDAAAQVRDVVWYLSTPESRDFQVIEYRLRAIFPQELLLLLGRAGFRLETRYGDFSRIPFDSASPRQLCRCSLKSG